MVLVIGWLDVHVIVLVVVRSVSLRAVVLKSLSLSLLLKTAYMAAVVVGIAGYGGVGGSAGTMGIIGNGIGVAMGAGRIAVARGGGLHVQINGLADAVRSGGEVAVDVGEVVAIGFCGLCVVGGVVVLLVVEVSFLPAV